MGSTPAEDAVQEFIPGLAGALVGLAAFGIPARRWRAAAIVAASLGIGLVASAISGELAAGWAFPVVDAVQALVMALLALAAVALWHALRTPRPYGEHDRPAAGLPDAPAEGTPPP